MTTPSNPERGAGRAKRWAFALLRWLGTAALLAATLYFVDVSEVIGRLRELAARWVAAALGVAVMLYAVLGARWWFTARRLEVPLSYREACLEYYGSLFVNRVLPLPAAGEALRVVRHRRRLATSETAPGYGPVVRTVVLEKISGQVALALIVAVAGVVWLLRGYHAVAPVVFGGVVIVLAMMVLGLVAASRRAGASAVERFFRDVREALVLRGAWCIQLVLSLSALLLLTLKFYCAGRAVGGHLELWTVVQVVPLVIGATLVPLTSSGWGVREATTGLLYGLLGLEPGEGVAVALTFGLIGVAATLPGALVLLAPARAQGEAAKQLPWWRRGEAHV